MGIRPLSISLPIVGLLLLSCSVLIWPAATAKEVEVTKEWKLLGENDTIPAGMHVRMDMTTGEKWVKLVDEEDSGAENVAVLQEDGSVQAIEDANENSYDYDVMHRTLSKLPEEEKARIGGIPELPSGRTRLSSEERRAFETKMAEIWEKRQAELEEAQESLLDLPEVLKERIRSIRAYLKDPTQHLQAMDLQDDDDKATHIVAVLKDLEFQLADVDNARDFHTVGGWQNLVSLLSDDVHSDKAISSLSRATEAKIRSVQAHAAWAIGTAVKNTAEFFPYAVEAVVIQSQEPTTAIDLLIDVLCRDYKDPNAWAIRTLQTKGVYGLGSLLRGNRLAQLHIVQGDGAMRLSDKFRKLSGASFTSANAKLINRFLSLSGDIVSDIQLHGDKSTADDAILKAFTSPDWCDTTSTLLRSDSFLPVRVQETLLTTIDTLAPFCSWADKQQEHELAVDRLAADWNQDDFDKDHFDELNGLAAKARRSLKQRIV